MHALKHHSRRFAKDNDWLVSRYKYRTDEICATVSFQASHFGETPPTARELREVAHFANDGIQRDALNNQMESLLKKLKACGHKMKTSYLNISMERRKLLAHLASPMIEDPTWFLTLSSADRYWPDLFYAILAPESLDKFTSLLNEKEHPESLEKFKILQNSLPGDACVRDMEFSLFQEYFKYISYAKRTKILSENPVVACQMFRSRIDNILEHILKGSCNPVGFLRDFWIRFELQNRGSLHAHIILWAWLISCHDDTWWTGDELSALVLGNIIASDGNNVKITEREAHLAGLILECKCSESSNCKMMLSSHLCNKNESNEISYTDNIVEDEMQDFIPVNEQEDAEKIRIRAARQLLADIASQYINATMPCKANGFNPTDPTPNTKMLKPDSIEHASLRMFNFDDICSKYEITAADDIDSDNVEQEMERELYDMYTSVQLHLEEHTFTCFKKGCFCR